MLSKNNNLKLPLTEDLFPLGEYRKFEFVKYGIKGLVENSSHHKFAPQCPYLNKTGQTTTFQTRRIWANPVNKLKYHGTLGVVCFASGLNCNFDTIELISSCEGIF